MRLWRIATETRDYKATDLSGAGSAKAPGRWNNENQPVVYCSTSIALAVLETAAHVDTTGLPLNRFLVEIAVPDSVWDKRQEFNPAELPATWCAIPAGAGSVAEGSGWLASNDSLLLLVPSVIVPEERNALINPRHPDALQINARVARPFEYDRLFRPAAAGGAALIGAP